MSKPLTVGVDGSETSLRALDWAVAEAGRRGVPLRVVHAALWERCTRVTHGFGTGVLGHRVPAEDIVGAARARAALIGPGVETTGDVLADDPFGALIRAAPGSCALVVGNRGRSEVTDMLLGSVGLTVAGRAPCPVYVVRGAGPNVRGDFGRVSLGVGHGGESSAAVRFAFRAAQARRARLSAVHAWRGAEGEGEADPGAALAARLLDGALGAVRGEYPQVTVHAGTAEARARTVLLEASASSDLLVVGARHRDGRPGLQLGPVNHALLHHAACPVAVVPQTA